MTFSKLLAQLTDDVSDVTFSKSEYFYWSPYDRTVYYRDDSENDKHAVWTLLHETAHGILDHFDFKSDFQLIKLEAEAWEKTLLLCQQYDIQPPHADYIQDCIDTYRNWQYRRSLCPECDSGGVQTAPDTYRCIGCHNHWRVTKQRFCRSYRKNKTTLVS